MTLFPGFAVTAGTTELRSGGQGDLWSLAVTRAVNRGADEARLKLGRSAELSVETGESLEVELGYDDSLHRVFTGTVTEVAHGASSHEILALGSQHLLMSARVDRSFQAQSAGEIFQALADEAGAEVEQAENGVPLSFYLADSSLSCWEHALRLAFHGGCDLLTTVEGGLVFAPLPAPAAPRRLLFGVDLIRIALDHTPSGHMPRYLPESPASAGGEETWLAKDNSGALGEAGEGSASPFYRPLMRTQEQAQMAADTHWLRVQRDAESVSAELLGLPELELGDAVQLEQLPADQNGVYQIVTLEHRFDFRRGFRTRARLAGTGGGA